MRFITVKSTPTKFNYHEDENAGWLEVPFSALEALGLELKISSRSARKKDTVYLEKGEDMHLFIDAWLLHKGLRPGVDDATFHECCTDHWDGAASPIRTYPTYEQES